MNSSTLIYNGYCPICGRPLQREKQYSVDDIEFDVFICDSHGPIAGQHIISGDRIPRRPTYFGLSDNT